MLILRKNLIKFKNFTSVLFCFDLVVEVLEVGIGVDMMAVVVHHLLVTRHLGVEVSICGNIQVVNCSETRRSVVHVVHILIVAFDCRNLNFFLLCS